MTTFSGVNKHETRSDPNSSSKMKPITFESIRNFLRAKKKNKKDGSDASFKRSDSFKRISIRRSYLDRGRKRAIMRSGNVVAVVNHGGPSMRVSSGSGGCGGNGKDALQFATEIEVKNDGGELVGRFNGPGSGSGNTAVATDNILPNERAIDAEIEKQFCFKNKSLQEINELCGGGSSFAMRDRRQSDGRHVAQHFEPTKVPSTKSNRCENVEHESKEMITSTGCFVKAGSKMKKPIGTSVAVTSEVTSVRCDDDAPLPTDYRSIVDTEQHQSPKKHLSLSHSNVAAVELGGELRRTDGSCVSVDSAYVKNPHGRRSTKATSTTTIVSGKAVKEGRGSTPSINRPNSNDNEMPSLVIFKTYCNEQSTTNASDKQTAASVSSKIKDSNQYLETSFDGAPGVGDKSKRGNVTRTSLNHELVTITNSMINSQTFKVAPSKVRTMAASTATIADKCIVEKSSPIKSTASNGRFSETSSSVGGIVIRIPDSHTYIENVQRSGDAADDRTSSCDDITYASHKNQLQKKLSHDSALDDAEYDGLDRFSTNIVNEETSLNGKFTFEIYKELQRTRDSDAINSGHTQRTNRSGDSRLTMDSSMERPTTAESPDDIETMDSTFRALHLNSNRTDKLTTHQNFYLEPEPNEYDDVNIISPDSSIPYPLRIKTNPFTHQKEPYSVNLGRVWKQLNLGQDDQSLETAVALPQTAIMVQPAAIKVKNESFKSMSSRDSGFSLTLTKQKNIFDRKGVAPKKPRRKSKMTLNRDGYFKKVSVVSAQSHNSTRRKKKKKGKSSATMTPSPQLLIRKLQHLQPPHPSITAINSMFDEDFYETFSRYYKNRQKKTVYGDDDANDADGVNFSQEISDLEAFFEEHLKRLKDYYMQKKKLNEQTINELCHEYEQNPVAKCERDAADQVVQAPPHTIEHVELNNDDYINEKYFMMANDTLKRKQKIKQKRKQLMKPASPSSIYSKLNGRLAPPALTHSSEISTLTTSYNDEFDYMFPHPDKRSSSSGNNSKKKTKFQTQEVRDFNQIASDDTENMSLKYASLDFADHMGGDRYHRTTVMLHDGNGSVTPPYAALAFPVARDPNDFPYGKFKSKETNRRNKFKKSFESNSGGSRRREYRLANRSTVSSEIYLSSIFPSIVDETMRRTSPVAVEMLCKHCHKNAPRLRYDQNPDDFDEYTDIDDDDDDGLDDGNGECDNLTSDEFSENEFIANSLGSELCLVCDKLHTECMCSLENGDGRVALEQQQSPKKPARNSKKLCYCDCTSGVYTSTLKSSAAASNPNKRKIKRIKSKRRIVGKNHSLRRDYCYYSSEYEFIALLTRVKRRRRQSMLSHAHTRKRIALMMNMHSINDLLRRIAMATCLCVLGRVTRTPSPSVSFC